jgi:cysteine desulfurase/selenocysteine lyase
MSAVLAARAAHAGITLLYPHSKVGERNIESVIDTQFQNTRALEFPGTERAIYLNAAGFGPLPERTRAALNRFTDQRHRNQLRDVDLMGALTVARESAARLINATPAEIALVPNTNVGINIAVNAVLERATEKPTVLFSAREFPANVYPWLALQYHGFDVEIVPPDERGMPHEDAIMERVRAGDVAAVSVSFVQFASGFRADLDALSRVCAQHDTLFVVDAIQGLGAVPLDVRQTTIDVLACGAQKWLCSPWGSGFTYVRQELINTFDPAFPGWLAFKASHDFTNLLNYEYEFVNDARRFEVGSIAFQDQLGMSISIALLLELGVENIWRYLQGLQQQIIDWAINRRVDIVSDLTPSRRSGILCLRPPQATAVHKALLDAGVACAFRENSIRLAPHWYNTQAEIARVIEIMDSVVA